MLGHLGLNVADLAVAREYYRELLPLLGYEILLDRDDEFGYRPADGRRGTYLFFYPAVDTAPYHRDRTGLQHLAFSVADRSQVRAAHARAVALGSTVLHEPRSFPQYPPPYFAAFWLDPFGFMLETVCHHDRD